MLTLKITAHVALDWRLINQLINQSITQSITHSINQSINQFISIFIFLHQIMSTTYKSRSEDFRKMFKEVPREERLVVGEYWLTLTLLLSLP